MNDSVSTETLDRRNNQFNMTMKIGMHATKSILKMLIKKLNIYSGIFFFTLGCSCGIEKETAVGILQKSIQAIDHIETIFYKQDMLRTNPRNITDTIFRYREMYFQRLPADSLVGVKGHWYMYIEDKRDAAYEDIYDGNRLLRINNRDSIVRIYDLDKYPAFEQKHFWSHNTPYSIQFEFRYILEHLDFYSIERLNDTIIDDKKCYQIHVELRDWETMPGFQTELKESLGNVRESKYFIEQIAYYPICFKSVSYSNDQSDQTYFIEQIYYDITFNLNLNSEGLFRTDTALLTGFEINEIIPTDAE